MRVNDEFCAVSSSGTMHDVAYSKKPPLAATQAVSMRTQGSPFSSTSNHCPRSVTRGSKVPAVLRDLQGLDAERAVS